MQEATLTENQMRQRIYTSDVGDQTIHYSLAKKYQATVSMFGMLNNERLLIYN